MAGVCALFLLTTMSVAHAGGAHSVETDIANTFAQVELQNMESPEDAEKPETGRILNSWGMPAKSDVNNGTHLGRSAPAPAPLLEEGCPFETVYGDNPCLHPECVQSVSTPSTKCIAITIAFCAKHPDNVGCLTIKMEPLDIPAPAPSSNLPASHVCPFDKDSSLNPCARDRDCEGIHENRKKDKKLKASP